MRYRLKFESVILLLGATFIAFMVIRTVTRDRESYRRGRTSADLRALSMAIEAYANDHERVPRVASIDELVPLLSPTYSRGPFVRDGWGRPFRYEVRSRFIDCQVREGTGFVLASAGPDGRFSPSTERYLAQRDLSSRQELRELAAQARREGSDDYVVADGALIVTPHDW